MKRMSISSVAEQLGYKNNDAAIRWCRKHNITIVSDAKENQVFEAEFRLVADKPIIDKLKDLYPKNWSEKYYQLLDGKILELLEEDNSTITAVPKFSEGTSTFLNEILSEL